VTIAYCSIHTGDDDVAVKSGRSGPASNISILHNHFYTGHGMSIGSGTNGGVDHMLVEDLTIDGATTASASSPTAAAAAWCTTLSIATSAFVIRRTRRPLRRSTPPSAATSFPCTATSCFRMFTRSRAGKLHVSGLDAQHKLGADT